jgi:hypothetical protein
MVGYVPRAPAGLASIFRNELITLAQLGGWDQAGRLEIGAAGGTKPSVESVVAEPSKDITPEEVERRANDNLQKNLAALAKAYRAEFGDEIGPDNGVLAELPAPESGDAPLAGLAGGRRPQPHGGLTAMSAAFR